jgi:hypothetical protein
LGRRIQGGETLPGGVVQADPAGEPIPPDLRHSDVLGQPALRAPPLDLDLPGTVGGRVTALQIRQIVHRAGPQMWDTPCIAVNRAVRGWMAHKTPDVELSLDRA